MKSMLSYLGLLLLPFSGYAAQLEGLYEAEVAVVDQSSNTRNAAMGVALAEVLVKVSGRPDVLKQPGIAELMQNPAVLVQQYLYRKLSEEAKKQSTNTHLLWFQFDEKPLNNALRNKGIAVWGKTRPATVVWIAVEQGNARSLLGGEALADIRLVLEQQAKRNGVALIVPLNDLEDQMALKFADVWGNFQDAIIRASARYQGEAILVGRISQASANDWSARWDLYEGGRTSNWSAQSAVLVDVINSGIVGNMEILASRFRDLVASGSGTGSLTLTVQDVRSLTGFNRVSRYLKSLEQITAVKPIQIAAGQASFLVELRGSIEGLAQTLALGNTLRKAALTGASADASPQGTTAALEQTYRLLP